MFLIILSIGFGGYFWWKAQSQPQAAIQFAQEPQFSSIYQVNAKIQILPNGKVIMDNRDISKALKRFPNYYELSAVVLDNSGSFVGHLRTELILPKAVNLNQIEQNIIAIHGVESYSSSILDNQTLIFEADNISSQATVTVIARLPKDIVNPPLSEKILYFLNQLPFKVQLWLAIIFPLMTLLMLFYMVMKRRISRFKGLKFRPSPAPPRQISPALAGVLFDSWIGARGIASTLIDLANRGYIFIIHKETDFSFGKRKSMNLENMPELRKFERILLSKIFEPQEYKSTRGDVEMRVGHHIFSRKIAQAYLEVYNEADNVGYFIKNPARVHLRWKYAGIGLFFLGAAGFILTAWLAPDPKFTLFFWVGEMIAASEIIKFAPLMPVRSLFGDMEMKKWLAFREYLALRTSIEPKVALMDGYLRYLPYAIIFGVEVEWTRRFAKEPFVKPDWYESFEEVVTRDSFAQNLFPIISYVSGTLDKSHEPTVE